MTREEMIRQIAHLAGKCGPFNDPDCWDKHGQVIEWVAKAPEGWFDVLFDVITHPPDWVQYEKEHNLWLEEGWEEWEYAHLVGTGIRQDIEHRLPLVGPLLSRLDTRLLILRAFSYALTVDLLPWLKPLMETVATLSENEQIALAEDVGSLKSDETLAMLLHMRDVIPKTAVEVQKNIDDYLPLPYFVPMQTLEEGNKANE